MIYTVTFNPAIDYVVQMDGIVSGTINKYYNEKVFFGGKGINVSLILKELGCQSTAFGFVAGFTGEAIEKGISEKGINTDFIHLENGISRVNFKIKSKEETEINGKGPVIEKKHITALYEKLDRLTDGDTLVLAGSIPQSLPTDIYSTIIGRLYEKKIRFVVDATGSLLRAVLSYRPYLIKPNNFELGELFDVTISTQEDALVYAKRLQTMGARNVLVSMAEKGAVLLDENGKAHTIGVCKGTVKNSVGAGDSMLAGFIAGADMYGDYGKALKLATCAGGATAFSEGIASREDIFRLFDSIS